MVAPDRIRGVSQSMFSVARYYGGCTAFGASYTYNPTTDELVRDDVLKREQKLEKAKKNSSRKAKSPARLIPGLED